MNEIILYPAVYLGMASFPVLFFAGLYFLQKKYLRSSAGARTRWVAAFAYSAATLGGWAALYFFGESLPLGETMNSLASLSQMFGYSAYALLPAAAVTAAVSLVGALVCVVRDLGLRSRKV